MSTRVSQFKKIVGAVGVLAVTAGVPAAVYAQDAGFYVGGAIGQTKAKDGCDDAAPLACDDKDTGYKIFGGYQINSNFGVELGYVDLGEVTATGVLSGVPASASVEANGFELVGVGTIPLANNFSAYGKLGIFRWDVDAKATLGGTAGSLSDNGTDLTFGLGLKYDVTKNIAARLEWQRYNDIGDDATTGRSDVDLLSIGIVFKF